MSPVIGHVPCDVSGLTASPSDTMSSHEMPGVDPPLDQTEQRTQSRQPTSGEGRHDRDQHSGGDGSEDEADPIPRRARREGEPQRRCGHSEGEERGGRQEGVRPAGLGEHHRSGWVGRVPDDSEARRGVDDERRKARQRADPEGSAAEDDERRGDAGADRLGTIETCPLPSA